MTPWSRNKQLASARQAKAERALRTPSLPSSPVLIVTPSITLDSSSDEPASSSDSDDIIIASPLASLPSSSFSLGAFGFLADTTDASDSTKHPSEDDERLSDLEDDFFEAENVQQEQDEPASLDASSTLLAAAQGLDWSQAGGGYSKINPTVRTLQWRQQEQRKKDEERAEHRRLEATGSKSYISAFFPSDQPSRAPAPSPPPLRLRRAPPPLDDDEARQYWDFINGQYEDGAIGDTEMEDEDDRTAALSSRRHRSPKRKRHKARTEEERLAAASKLREQRIGYQNALRKMVQQYALPSKDGAAQTGRKQVWESHLQAARVKALESYYNHLLDGTNLGKIEASERASVGAGRAAKWGGRKLREWAEEFELDKTIPTSRRGTHAKTASLLSDPEVCQALRLFLRTHKWSMDPKTLQEYATTTMLPDVAEKAARNLLQHEMPVAIRRFLHGDLFSTSNGAVSGGITLRTARRWLKSEGFAYRPYAKGIFIDGHERPDVVEYRQNVFLPKLFALRPRIIEYNPKKPEEEVVKDRGEERPVLVVFHDESTFQANDAQKKVWVRGNEHKLRKKGVGRGQMSSDCIDVVTGWLPEAGEVLEYGKNHDGYWTGKDVVEQLQNKILPAYEARHPGVQLLLVFDHSAGHKIFPPDALVCKQDTLNQGPNGANVPIMPDGWTHEYTDDGDPIIDLNSPDGLKRVPFPMVLLDDDGSPLLNAEGKPQPCGMRDALTRRGLWRKNLVARCSATGPKGNKNRCDGSHKCCAMALLASQPDFREQKCMIEEIVTAAGHLCIFLPKYHCELNIIEFFWGATKRYTRENCAYDFEELKKTILAGKQTIKTTTIRRWQGQMFRWCEAYRGGLAASRAKEQVERFSSRRYKSHRRSGDVDSASEEGEAED